MNTVIYRVLNYCLEALLVVGVFASLAIVFGVIFGNLTLFSLIFIPTYLLGWSLYKFLFDISNNTQDILNIMQTEQIKKSELERIKNSVD